MIESLVTFLHVHIIPLGAIGIFIGAVIQEIIPPIPSPSIMLAGGFLFVADAGGANALLILILKVALPAALGITLGSLVIYGLAYAFGKPFIEKYGKWIGLSWREMEKVENWMEKGLRDDILIFASRAIPIVPSVAIGVFSGLMRFPLRTYIISSFLGTLVRALILGFVGWQIGHLYSKYAEIIGRLENYILIIIVLSLLIWIFIRIVKKKEKIDIN
ncbi:MAG TPA: VTT domain-containing protein [Candidatus Paceibacterota bacterium]